MDLNSTTIQLVHHVVGVELVLMLAVMDRLLRGEPGLRPWLLGIASATAGGLALALRGTVPEAIASLVGSGLLAAGPALAWVGAREFCGRSRSRWPVWLGLAAVLVAVALAPLVQEQVICSSAVGWSAAIVFTLLRHAPEQQRRAVRVSALFFALHAAVLLARIFVPPSTAVALSVGTTIFGIAWTFSIVGLMSQRLVTKLRDVARTDGLTGLLNRRAFCEDAAQVLELCTRQRRPSALLLADLDHFKRLNDTFGHGAGDDVLRHFAAEASALAGNGTLIGRFGGEEFCILLPGASRETARAFADRLRSALGRIPAARIATTVSIGWTSAEGQELQLSRMIAQADLALYRAKAGGRDRACEAA